MIKVYSLTILEELGLGPKPKKELRFYIVSKKEPKADSTLGFPVGKLEEESGRFEEADILRIIEEALNLIEKEKGKIISFTQDITSTKQLDSGTNQLIARKYLIVVEASSARQKK